MEDDNAPIENSSEEEGEDLEEQAEEDYKPIPVKLSLILGTRPL